MREIKFRTLVNGEWFYFDLTQNPKYWAHKLEDGIIDQYTGLKDVNDVEIYEGDIVRAYHRLWEQHVTLKVHYLNGCFMFGNYNAHGFFKEHQNIEVIGNIFENHELLLEEN